MKADPGRVGLDSLLKEIDKLQTIRQLELPENLLANTSPKILHHYRRMVPQILDVLEFRSNNELYQPVIGALELIRKYTGSPQHYYSQEDEVLIDGVLKNTWRDIVVEVDASGAERINRVNYEISVLQALRDQLRSKEIWVVGAKRYGNPEEDLPKDFEAQRQVYYQALSQPTDGEAFIASLQQKMTKALEELDLQLSKNSQVKILTKDNGWILVSPLEAQPEPLNLQRLKAELISRWPMTSLLDVLKETDLRVGFTEQFHSVSSRETLERKTLQRRLLLCLFGLGTNTGLKRISTGGTGENYPDLLYIKRHTSYLPSTC